MKIRKTASLVCFLALSGVSPAFADCCSSFFDCAAAVVTDGLSCEVETIISTIKTLQTLVTNLGNDITGQTQSAQRDARQWVTDGINSRRSQSQQGMSDLTQAKSQADTLYHEESSIVSANEKTNVSVLPTAQSPSSSSSSSSGRFANSSRLPNSQLTQQATASSQPPRATSVIAPQNVTTMQTTTPQGNSLEKTTVAPSSDKVVTADSLKGAHGAYREIFARALKQITALTNTGTSDLDRVNQFLADAQSSEGAGVAQANTLAGALMSPLTSIQSQLSSMLSNPLSAFDPSSQVDSVEDSIKADLSVNIQQMIDDITTGPSQQFDLAKPTYDDLLANAESAQAIAAAMARLYQDRTPGAANALDALLPKVQPNVPATRSSASLLPSAFGQRLSASKLKAAMNASRQKTLASVRPLNLAPLHAALTQFKAQRAAGKTAQSPSMLALYRTNTAHQFDSYFANKTPLDVSNERDQLVAQARTRFAQDQKTQNGVINLINQEAQKRGAASNGVAMSAAATPNSAARPTGASSNFGAPAPVTGVRPPVSAVPASMQSSSLPTAISPTHAVAPPAQTAPNASAWSAPPAWKPPATATAPMPAAPSPIPATQPASNIIKPVSTIKAVPKPQPATSQPPPSSMATSPQH